MFKKLYSTKNHKVNEGEQAIQKNSFKNKLLLDPSYIKLQEDILKKNTVFHYLKSSSHIVKKSGGHPGQNKIDRKHKKSLSNNFFSEFKKRNKNGEKLEIQENHKNDEIPEKKIYHLKSLTSTNLKKEINNLKNNFLEGKNENILIQQKNEKSHFSQRKTNENFILKKEENTNEGIINYNFKNLDLNPAHNLYFKQEKLRSFVKSVKKVDSNNNKIIHQLIKKIKNNKKTTINEPEKIKQKNPNYDYVTKFKKSKNRKIFIKNNINIKNKSICKKNEFKGKINIMIDFNNSHKKIKNSLFYKGTPQEKLIQRIKKGTMFSNHCKQDENNKNLMVKLNNKKEFQSKQSSPNQNQIRKKHRKMISNIEFSKKAKKIVFNLKIDLNNKNLDNYKEKKVAEINETKIDNEEMFFQNKNENHKKHKKNVLSLPDKNIVCNYLKNINLPINLLNPKKISMTPDISKKNSPRKKFAKFKKNSNIKKKNSKSIFKITEREDEVNISSNNSIENNKSVQVIENSIENISLHSFNDKDQDEQNTKRTKIKENNFIVNKNDLMTQINLANKKKNTKEDFKKKLIKNISKYIKINNEIPETSLDFYQIISLLGEGSYGKVYLGKSILTKKKVAIKCYDRIKIKNQTTCKRILQEIDILRSLDHKNIIKIYEIFDNKKFIFIVMEYADAGDLLCYLKEYGKFEETEFSSIFKQIIISLHHLHTKRILHRDVKLDNILLTKSNQVKICDFGVSRIMPKKNLIFEHIGTPAYLAPEIIQEKGYHGFGADIWSLGVMTFIALTGQVPFKGEKIEELHYNILNKEITFEDFTTEISDRIKNVIIWMLEKNPKKRITLKKIAEIFEFKIPNHIKLEVNELDFNIVEKISELGFTKKLILKSLKEDKINHVSALYKILK